MIFKILDLMLSILFLIFMAGLPLIVWYITIESSILQFYPILIDIFIIICLLFLNVFCWYLCYDFITLLIK